MKIHRQLRCSMPAKTDRRIVMNNSRCRNFANTPKEGRKQLFSKVYAGLAVVVTVLVATEEKTESKFLSALC